MNTAFMEATESDFLPILSEVLTFSANGVTRQCVYLVVYKDNVVENVERLEIQLSGTISILTPSITVNILDNSRVNMSFTQRSYTTLNEDSPINICAQLVGGAIERQVVFSFQSGNTGTATSNDDYIPVAPTTYLFTPTTATVAQCVPITILPDTDIEDDEYLIMVLTSSDAVDFVQSTARVFIRDSDGVSFTLATSTVVVSEGNSGTTDVSVGITISWLPGHTLLRNVTLLGTTSDGPATIANGDYVMLSKTPLLTIPSTATNGQTFDVVVQVRGDLVFEQNEFFFVIFSGQRQNDVFLGNFRVQVLINNDGDVIWDCGELMAPAAGSVVVAPDTLQNSTATYSCSKGYDLRGSEIRICSSIGEWSKRAPVCAIVNCGNPPIPENGGTMVNSTDYLGRVIYTCVSGFVLRSGNVNETRTCLINGSWSGSDPACDRVNCELLESVENGNITYSNGGTLFESQATYVCDFGYDPHGSSERICLASGSWSNSAATCEPVNCGGLPGPDNGSVNVPVTTYPEVATYSCNANFEIVNGPMTRVCQADGLWSDTAPSCRMIQCPTISSPTNGVVAIDVAVNGDTSATYACDVGYTLDGDSIRTCQQDSQWSGTTPTCQIVRCPVLVSPANGVVDSPSNVYLSVSNYSCNIGYNQMGATSSICQQNGVWSEPPPTCIVVTCNGLSSPANGGLDVNLTTFESTASYSCNQGFRIVGSDTRLCQADGLWAGQSPTCEEIHCLDLMVVNGSVNLTDGTRVDSRATFSCFEGLHLIGPSSLTCMNDGVWSDITATCEVLCPVLSIDNGNVTLSDGSRPASVATPTCNDGFDLDGGASSRTCLENGQWSGTDSICIPGQSSTTIIGIAVGCSITIIIIIITVTVTIVILCMIRRKRIYRKYVLPYRSYIYANSLRNDRSSVINTEIQEWEANSRQHAVDAVDALAEKPQFL